MFFDQLEYSSVLGMFAFPVFPFGDLPLQPDQVGCQHYIQGSDSSNTAVAGSANCGADS